MFRKSVAIGVALLFLSSTGSAAEFKIGGVYTAWGQSQHTFLLQEDAYDQNYAVQMLRFNVQGIANDYAKFVTRVDIAQGWWGVDNALRSIERTGTSGGSAMFDYKDTNFLVHVDQAYADFTLKQYPINFKVGRQWYGLGHKLMVDNNYDGFKIGVGKCFTFGWAKVSEGADNTDDSYDVGSNIDNRDADLYMAEYKGKAAGVEYSAFGFYYKDLGIEDDKAYIHDNLQFFKTRFSPQVTELMAFGATAKYTAGKLTVDGEFNILTGKDEIDNLSYAGKKPDSYDINDGDLSGFNVYINADFTAAEALSIGAVFGLGSGDDDLTQGAGNVNKLRTSGFFYITEIWEDSIMPDEEGITPQGLGAPNVRGYRELENTTILQLNATYKGIPKTSVFVSGSLIMATQPVAAWGADTTGAIVIDNNTTATDLGTEVDFKVDYQVVDNVSFSLRGGYFMPGDAAGYLINGNINNLDPAWETKAVLLLKF